MTVTAGVEPPSVASVFFVPPLTWRSKRPGSLAGLRLLTTVMVPVFLVFVMVQVMFCPVVTGTSSEVPEPEATVDSPALQRIEEV